MVGTRGSRRKNGEPDLPPAPPPPTSSRSNYSTNRRKKHKEAALKACETSYREEVQVAEKSKAEEEDKTRKLKEKERRDAEEEAAKKKKQEGAAKRKAAKERKKEAAQQKKQVEEAKEEERRKAEEEAAQQKKQVEEAKEEERRKAEEEAAQQKKQVEEAKEEERRKAEEEAAQQKKHVTMRQKKYRKMGDKIGVGFAERVQSKSYNGTEPSSEVAAALDQSGEMKASSETTKTISGTEVESASSDDESSTSSDEDEVDRRLQEMDRPVIKSSNDDDNSSCDVDVSPSNNNNKMSSHILSDSDDSDDSETSPLKKASARNASRNTFRDSDDEDSQTTPIKKASGKKESPDPFLDGNDEDSRASPIKENWMYPNGLSLSPIPMSRSSHTPQKEEPPEEVVDVDNPNARVPTSEPPMITFPFDGMQFEDVAEVEKKLSSQPFKRALVTGSKTLNKHIKQAPFYHKDQQGLMKDDMLADNLFCFVRNWMGRFGFPSKVLWLEPYFWWQLNDPELRPRAVDRWVSGFDLISEKFLDATLHKTDSIVSQLVQFLLDVGDGLRTSESCGLNIVSRTDIESTIDIEEARADFISEQREGSLDCLLHTLDNTVSACKLVDKLEKDDDLMPYSFEMAANSSFGCKQVDKRINSMRREITTLASELFKVKSAKKPVPLSRPPLRVADGNSKKKLHIPKKERKQPNDPPTSPRTGSLFRALNDNSREAKKQRKRKAEDDLRSRVNNRNKSGRRKESVQHCRNIN